MVVRPMLACIALFCITITKTCDVDLVVKYEGGLGACVIPISFKFEGGKAPFPCQA